MDSSGKKGRAYSALRILLLVAIAIAVLVALSALFRPASTVQACIRHDDTTFCIQDEPANSIDVLFVGDSEVLRSFSPLQMWGDFGFTSFLCASSSQKLPYTNTALHRALKSQSPRVVVIETNHVFGPFSADEAILRALQEVFPILEHHNRWQNVTPGNLTLDTVKTFPNDMKGFLLSKKVVSADETNYMAPSDKEKKIPLANKAYLWHIVNCCRAAGAEPLLVSTPSTVNWNMSRHNGMKAFADEMGVDYIDLNVGQTKVGIDWKTESTDGGDHLNLAGATKVSDYMGRYLSERYGLADRRADDAYSSWNESLKHYRQACQSDS